MVGGRDVDVDGDDGAAVVVCRTGDEVGVLVLWVGEFTVPPAGVVEAVGGGTAGWDGWMDELVADDVVVLGATVVVTGVPFDGMTAGASRV